MEQVMTQQIKAEKNQIKFNGHDNHVFKEDVVNT